MRSSGKGGMAYWVKLPCLCLIAATMAFTMGVLIAPFLNLSRNAIISPDDPSRQLVISNQGWLVTSNHHNNHQVVGNLPVVDLPQIAEEQLPVSKSGAKEKVVKDSVDERDVQRKIEEEVAISSNASQILQLLSQQETHCNIFQGAWVEDHSEPLYRNETCPFLTQSQNCPGNGRPDSGYLNWKWKPAGCDLPRFDGVAFLKLMRGKTMAFIGDSVTRNQFEALMCTLWQVSQPVPRGNRKLQKWIFRDYNFIVIRIWSSWLVHSSKEAIDFAPANMTKLHLDKLDEKVSEFLPSFDVLVVATGHWWPKTAAYIMDGKVVGGQTWWNDSYTKQHDVLSGYGVAIKTAVKAILAYPGYKGLTILRTFSPEHYEGGAWNTGGSCTGKTKPLTDSELAENSYMDTIYAHQIAAVKEAEKSGENAEKLRVMDITRPFAYRADGHPGPYRNSDPDKKVERGPDGQPPPQDCLHWCMPGPIDTWNDYLFAMLMREYKQ